MSATFAIIEKKSGEKFLAKPYLLDPSEKWTLIANYDEGKEPEFSERGLGINEYRSDVKIVGNYETDKIDFSWQKGIKYVE